MESAVVDLLDSVPFIFELSLNVNDHVFTVPLAAVLHILDQCVSDLSNLYSRQDLGHLRFFDAILSFLIVL